MLTNKRLSKQYRQKWRRKIWLFCRGSFRN